MAKIKPKNASRALPFFGWFRRLATGGFLIGAAAAFILDQASKYFVVFHLDLKSIFSIDVIPPFLNFRMGWNTGINFGLLADDSQAARWILTGIALAVSAYLAWWATRPERRVITAVSCGLLAGGAMGNAYDRIAYGAVADFLNMSCCGIRNPYSFNVADIFVFAGVAGMLYFESFDSGRR